MGLIPENRKQEGLALTRSVHENLLAASLWRLFPKGFYRVEQAKRGTRELIASAYRAERQIREIRP